MRLGILGGSFNPLHVAHLAMAQAARETHNLDKVLLVPAGTPPHKREGLATAADRLEMVRLATVDDERLEPCAVEVERPGASFTYETLAQLQERYPEAELFFVMGEDSLHDLPNWRRPEHILELCRVVVVNRGAVEQADCRADLRRRVPAGVLAPALQAAVEQLEKDRVTMKPCAVSASEVRARVKAGESISDLVPPAVEQYIHERGLYR